MAMRASLRRTGTSIRFIILERGLATLTASCARSEQIMRSTSARFSAALSVQLGLQTFSMQPTRRSM